MIGVPSGSFSSPPGQSLSYYFVALKSGNTPVANQRPLPFEGLKMGQQLGRGARACPPQQCCLHPALKGLSHIAHPKHECQSLAVVPSSVMFSGNIPISFAAAWLTDAGSSACNDMRTCCDAACYAGSYGRVYRGTYQGQRVAVKVWTRISHGLAGWRFPDPL